MIKLEEKKNRQNCELTVFMKYGYELVIPSTYEVLDILRKNILWHINSKEKEFYHIDISGFDSIIRLTEVVAMTIDLDDEIKHLVR